MGFTGKKALAWKVRYIQAFNEMERALRQGRHGEPVQLPLSSVEDRRPLAALANTWVSLAPLSHRDAWTQIHAHTGADRAEAMTMPQVQQAMAFVQERIDAATIRQAPALVHSQEHSAARDRAMRVTEEACKLIRSTIRTIDSLTYEHHSLISGVALRSAPSAVGRFNRSELFGELSDICHRQIGQAEAALLGLVSTMRVRERLLAFGQEA